ncbi:MAG: recombination mediator RecR [Proteobacteria bacterium]|nr:recombination mediator RecR [Pseudomonadota bacterium]
MTGNDLDQLIQLFAKLPGLGPRSARRAVLALIKRRETLMAPLIRALQNTAERVKPCGACGNLDTQDPCAICRDPERDRSIICVVEGLGDLWALERSGACRGLYHVLGGTLSALDGVGPDELNIASLLARADPKEGVAEVILGLSATVDGQTTAHYVTERLMGRDIVISRFAHGVPIGGELDYLDDGTLTAALKARRPM